MDLLTIARQMTRAEFQQAATTGGGEHHGPCPFCKEGTDRFHIWPNHPSGKARFWCRRCNVGGDLADFLELTGTDHIEALRAAGVIGDIDEAPVDRPSHVPSPIPRSVPNVDPPPALWQERARAFVKYAQGQLWSAAGDDVRGWLWQRELTDDTIRTWGLGYNPAALYDDPGKWGLSTGHKVCLSPGVVIPCEIDGTLWYVQIRRPYQKKNGDLDLLAAFMGLPTWEPERKYMAVKMPEQPGGHRALFGAERLTGKRALLLAEGEFDAILAWQELRDLVDVVTLGGCKKAGGGLPARWLSRLLGYDRILVAFDVDENKAGDKGAADLLKMTNRARRAVVPTGTDITDFFQAGGDLRAWLTFHLEHDQS